MKPEFHKETCKAAVSRNPKIYNSLSYIQSTEVIVLSLGWWWWWWCSVLMKIHPELDLKTLWCIEVCKFALGNLDDVKAIQLAHDRGLQATLHLT